MGSLDEKWLQYLYDEEANKNKTSVSSPSSEPSSEPLRFGNVQSVIDNSTLEVTDRSQIINPYEIIKSFVYTNNAKGRKQYQEDLNALLAFQAQQQAAYDDWYNSSAQQALRDSEAGLNVDLLGLSGSGTAGTDNPVSNPLESVPSNSEIFTNVVSGFSSLISTAASVAALPSTFLQARAITEGQRLSNLSDFEGLVQSEISARLADSVSSAIQAGDSFDISKWFSNEDNFSNIIEAYAPSSSGAYTNAFNNVRKRMQTNLGSAYENGRITAENAKSFSGLVASGRYSPDIVAQVALMRPIAVAQETLEEKLVAFETVLTDWNTKYQEGLDVEKAIDVSNAKADYESEYYDELNGTLMSEVTNLSNELDKLVTGIRKDIKSNQWDIYKNDPNSHEGLGALYNILTDTPSSFENFFYSHAVEEFANLIEQKGLSEQLSNVIRSYDAYQAESLNPDNYKGLGKFMTDLIIILDKIGKRIPN